MTSDWHTHDGIIKIERYSIITPLLQSFKNHSIDIKRRLVFDAIYESEALYFLSPNRRIDLSDRHFPSDAHRKKMGETCNWCTFSKNHTPALMRGFGWLLGSPELLFSAAHVLSTSVIRQVRARLAPISYDSYLSSQCPTFAPFTKIQNAGFQNLKLFEKTYPPPFLHCQTDLTVHGWLSLCHRESQTLWSVRQWRVRTTCEDQVGLCRSACLCRSGVSCTVPKSNA